MNAASERSLRALGAQLVGIRAQVDAALACLDALLQPKEPAPVALEPCAPPLPKSFGQTPPPPLPRTIDVPALRERHSPQFGELS